MKLHFEECPYEGGFTTIVRVTPETDEERKFLQLMADKKPYVQGFTRQFGGDSAIETALINFLERKGEHRK